ncbi:hypothetical protein N7454_004056 [Penicillium verhagenii]|nr:hypothetical protein N7454_004056 [Penicillium verhagenii]
MQTIHTLSTFAKRSGGTNYSLYIIAIMAGCIVSCLIGFSLYSMYAGVGENGQQGLEPSNEQRRYMREVHQRNLNELAFIARRPDMIVPVNEKDMNY